MPGQMGFERVALKNIKILDIRPDENVIALKGSIPGSINSIIEITKI